MIALQLEAEGFDNQVVVFALGQAGDGYAADDACSGDVDGEAAAVGSVFGVRQSVFLGECGVVVLEIKTELIGAAVEARNNVRFALDPACVVGSGSGERGVEERLVRVAEAADVYDNGLSMGDCQLAEGGAQPPCGFGIEGRQNECGLLTNDRG